MKLSTKLGLTMATILFLMVCFGVFSIYELNKMNEIVIMLGQERMPSNRLAQRMNTLFSDMRIHMVYMTLTDNKNEVQNRKKLYTSVMSEFERTENEFAPLAALVPQINSLYQQLQSSQKEYFNEIDRITRMVDNGQKEEAEAALDQSVPMFKRCNGYIDEAVKTSVAIGNEAKIRAQEAYDAAKWLVIGIMIFVMLVGVVLAFIILRNVMHQLGKDPGVLGEIAQRVVNGDYNIDDGSPKVGVYGNVVEMVAALKEHIEAARQESENAKMHMEKAQKAMAEAEASEKVAQAKTAAMLQVADNLETVGNIVSSASTQLSAQIEESDRGTSESAQRLSEAATAMNEMNATVQEVARNAASASQASLETKEKAIAGAHIVEQSVHSIAGVHQRSLELKDDMTKLNEHAQDISRIMGVISDIADQTNLLALNAAIEAARAGEAGRGFAVVADEVRKLAEKTMSSTQDVGSAIKAIQDSTAKSMDGMNQALLLVEQATQLANQSGQALQEIVSTVEATADQVNAIATASEEQSAASEEINQSIDQVNDMSKQTAAAMAEAAKAVSDLSVQAHELTNVIAQLKTA